MATETWVLNETLTISGSNVYNNIEMTYSGQQRAYPIKSLKIYEYIDGRETAYSVLGQEQSVYSDENTSYELYGTGGGASGWFSYNGTLYNTWKFSQPVTDSTLLTWLQANGTKQETPSTNRTYDLSTNSKWASLSYGNHTVKIKAVGGGFGDSSFSNSAIVTKSVLERGTYKWIDNPTITADNQTDFSFTSNGESYTMVRTYVGAEGNYISYTDTSNAVTGYFSGHGWGTHSLNNGEWSSMEVKPAYQIITLETDIEVPTDFYNWAITDGNLVKSEILEAGTYKWVEEPVFPTSPILDNNIVFKYYPLNSNDIYNVLTSGSRIDIYNNRLYFSDGDGFQENGFNNGIWRTTTQNHSGDILVYTATDTNKLRTIVVESNQTVSADFYNWAITGGNLVKQTSGGASGGNNP